MKDLNSGPMKIEGRGDLDNKGIEQGLNELSLKEGRWSSRVDVLSDIFCLRQLGLMDEYTAVNTHCHVL